MIKDERHIDTKTSISKHAFSDLSCVSPLVFLYLLKGCYTYGTGKASVKFHGLQQQVYVALLNNSHGGPATFIAHCLCIMGIYGSYFDGFSHLLLLALRRSRKVGCNDDEDVLEAKTWASKLILGIVNGALAHDEGVLIKILQTFDVNLMNIETAMCDFSVKRNTKTDTAKEVVGQYILKLVEFQSYITAVDLLIHFGIRDPGEPFLLKLIEHRQLKAAEKWATFMGKPFLCLLVQKYVDLELLKPAYDLIKQNNLREEFPVLYHQSKESSLKKLAEQGVWEIAEARTKGDRKLLEYLVYLAMEAGYSEKVEELCDRYSFKGFLSFKEPETNLLQSRYLQLHDLNIEEVVWVDDINSLRDATCYFEECKVVGLDCEWKPNYKKGSRPSKVSIMQIASEKKAYILDLIKLYNDDPSILDEHLARIMHSPSILKLGYNFQCDAKQLSHSYGELNCFKHLEMLLDIQNVFKEPRGGLSGLAEKILGTALNKTRRNSDWEQRPLSQPQLEYAALDAAVLVHIFRHIGNHHQPKIEWKSHIVSHMKNTKRHKKDTKTGEGTDAITDVPGRKSCRLKMYLQHYSRRFYFNR